VGFSTYGTAPLDTGQLQTFPQAAGSVVTQLRLMLLDASTKIGASAATDWLFGTLTGSDASDAAVKKNLATDKARVDKLESDEDSVRSGDMAPESWFGQAKTLAQDISFQLGVYDTSGPSLDRFEKEVIGQTALDTVDAAKQAATTSWPLLLVVLAILVALIILRFS
jgi:hypothetical protein